MSTYDKQALAALVIFVASVTYLLCHLGVIS